jgi:hypothetical protein
MLETDLVPDGQVGLIPRQLTEEQVASILGVSVAWCQRMRWAGGGPPYRKIARDTGLRPSCIAHRKLSP